MTRSTWPRRARDTKSTAEVILFCGVHFMAETAKILNPEKHRLGPAGHGCGVLARRVVQGRGALRAFKAKNHPDHYVVSYINCTAATKAESNVICTSSNAEQIIHSIPADRPILFAPDQNLGRWLIKKTGREMDLWPGTCMVHVTFSERRILELKAQNEGAKFIAHPECEPDILRHADFVGSTRKLLNYVATEPYDTIIVGTETGILHTMRKQVPHKNLIAVPFENAHGCEGCNQCPYMKLNTLEKMYLALRDLKPEIQMEEGLRQAALAPLQRMLELS